MLAKQVTGNTGMKPVVSQAFFATKQIEPVCIHDQVQVAGFLAD